MGGRGHFDSFLFPFPGNGTWRVRRQDRNAFIVVGCQSARRRSQRHSHRDGEARAPFPEAPGSLLAHMLVCFFIKLDLVHWPWGASDRGRSGNFHIWYYVAETGIRKRSCIRNFSYRIVIKFLKHEMRINSYFTSVHWYSITMYVYIIDYMSFSNIRIPQTIKICASLC